MEPTEPIVFVVDDDASVRTAIGRLLTSVGLPCETFEAGGPFLARAAESPAGCAIMDMRLPGSGGLTLQEQLVAAGSDLPVIFVSGYADVRTTVRAMKAGALEVLTKPFEDQHLLDLVNHALQLNRERRLKRATLASLRARLDTLTPREREVMEFVVTGMLNKQIAERLGTTEKTIKAHRAQVMHKMSAPSLAALVRMADQLNLSSNLA
jgi:FixJ family two-component response regulator